MAFSRLRRLVSGCGTVWSSTRSPVDGTRMVNQIHNLVVPGSWTRPPTDSSRVMTRPHPPPCRSRRRRSRSGAGHTNGRTTTREDVRAISAGPRRVTRPPQPVYAAAAPSLAARVGGVAPVPPQRILSDEGESASRKSTAGRRVLRARAAIAGSPPRSPASPPSSPLCPGSPRSAVSPRVLALPVVLEPAIEPGRRFSS